MKANKGLVAAIVVGVAAVAAVAAFAVNAMKGPPNPQYLTAVARLGDIENSVLATGSLQPAEVIDVGSQTSGQIISMKVHLGDLVKAGDLIAKIDPISLENQVRQ